MRESKKNNIIESSLRISKAVQDRTLLITGATGGIGEAILKCVAAEFTKVVILYASNKLKAMELQEQLEHKNIQAMIIGCDLRDQESVRRMLDEASKNMGDITDCIHCASPKINVAPVLLQEWQEFQDHLNIQLYSAMLLLKEILPAMQAHQEGNIVVLLSTVICGNFPKQWWPYITAKYALAGFVNGLAKDIDGSGVRLIGIVSGGVDTDLARSAGVPQNALLAPDELGHLVLKGLNNKNQFHNGTLILIEKGSHPLQGQLTFQGKNVE